MLRAQKLHSILDLPRNTNYLWHSAVRISLLLPLKSLFDSLHPETCEIRLELLSSVENETNFIEIVESGNILSLGSPPLAVIHMKGGFRAQDWILCD